MEWKLRVCMGFNLTRVKVKAVKLRRVCFAENRNRLALVYYFHVEWHTLLLLCFKVSARVPNSDGHARVGRALSFVFPSKRKRDFGAGMQSAVSGGPSPRHCRKPHRADGSRAVQASRSSPR